MAIEILGIIAGIISLLYLLFAYNFNDKRFRSRLLWCIVIIISLILAILSTFYLLLKLDGASQ